jgi:hypothetical protein
VVSVTVRLRSVRNVNIQAGSFDVTVVLATRGGPEGFDPAESLQLINGRTRVMREVGRVGANGAEQSRLVWLDATVEQTLDAARYPFDRHLLQLIFLANLPRSRLEIRVDDAASGLAPDLFSPGWQIGRPTLESGVQAITAEPGAAASQPSSEFARVTFSVPVRRDAGILGLSGFAGFAAAIAISLFSYAVPANSFAARLGAINGGLFAAVGNRYLVNDRLGRGSSIPAESASATAFAIVVLALAAAIVSERLRVTGRATAAANTDCAVFAVTLALAAFAVARIVLSAIG